MSLVGNPPIFSPADAIADIQRAYYTWIIQNTTASSALAQLMANLAAQQAAGNDAQTAAISANSSKFDAMIADLVNLHNDNVVTQADLVNIVTAVNNLQTSFNPQPTIWKYADVSATGDTVIWTPATGKKFRLMAYNIETTSNIAGNASISISLKDGSTAMGMGTIIWAPLLAVATGSGRNDTGWRDLKAGYLSLAANNTLKATLSAALTGTARINMMGREE